MTQETIRPGRWRHFKGNEYQVLGLARHSETLEDMVVYRALTVRAVCGCGPRPCGWKPWTGTGIAAPASCASGTEP